MLLYDKSIAALFTTTMGMGVAIFLSSRKIFRWYKKGPICIGYIAIHLDQSACCGQQTTELSWEPSMVQHGAQTDVHCSRS